jgi:hypothetical protein
MANFFNIPLLTPFKFVPSTNSPNTVSDFDGAWACEQIKSFERKVYYKQKWKKSDTTKLQIESSIAPETLKVYNAEGVIVKTFAWAAVYSAVNYTVYETTFDISDLAEGVYYLYQRVTLLSIDWKAISEPIHSKTSWPNTLLFTYKNSYNDQDVAFSTGVDFKFRCEAGIMDFNPERERTAYINQVHDTESLSGVPFRTYKLYIGEAPGVAPYIIDLLNRIFCCDSINIEGKFYQSTEGSKWEVTRAKGYPLIGGSIEIAEANNVMSLQFADIAPLATGIVTAYNIETAFFGPGSLVPVTDIEEQS